MRLLSFKVLRTFVKKEFTQILRTREMKVLLFGVPVIQLLVMGFAVTNEVKHVKLYIEDRDQSTLSRQLSDSFSHTDRFNVINSKVGQSPQADRKLAFKQDRNPTLQVGQSPPADRKLAFEQDQHPTLQVGQSPPADRNATPLELITTWKTQIAVIIPPGFARDIALNRQPAIQIMADGLDGNTAAVAVNYAQGIIAQFILTKVVNQNKLPQTPQVLAQIPPQVTIQDRMWYNQDLDSAQYMIPGIIAILLTVTSMMLSAMSLVKEKEIGTLEQLMVTPVTKTELLLGKLIPFWIISMFEITLVTLLGHLIFGIHFSGSVISLGIMAAVFLLTTLGLGIFISTVTQTQQQAMFFAWFVMVFMLLLSGLFIPIQNMPVSIRRLTLINPMSYFMTITREIIIKGNGLIYLWKECLALLVYGISVFIFSVGRFRKRV